MQPLELAQKLVAQFGELLSAPIEFREEITIVLRDADRIVEVCSFGKTSLGFNYLVDITSVDNYGDDPRFTVVYELYGLARECYLRIKTPVSEEVSELPTVTNVWRTANWHERE